MAALYARGELGLNEDFHHEGILGTIFTGRLIRETKVGQYTAVVPTISGQAWIASGGYANFRLKMVTGNATASSVMDDFSVTLESVAVPEPSSYALLAGLFACTYMMIRRRKVS